MYCIGDVVAYGAHGVCRVINTEHRKIDRKEVSYLVLEPQGMSGTSFYVPMNQPAAMAKIRPVITKNDLDDAFAQCGDVRDYWIEEESRRKQSYRALMSSGDWRQVLYTLIAVHNQKELLRASGKKVHLCDENFLRDAQKMLDKELSFALGIPEGQVPGYVVCALRTQ